MTVHRFTGPLLAGPLFALALLGSPAGAATVTLTPGATIAIDPDAIYEYQTVLSGRGAAGSRKFTFVAKAADTPFAMQAIYGISQILSGMLTNPTLSWTASGTTAFAVLEPTFGAGGKQTGFTAAFPTDFTVASLKQTLTLGWTRRTGTVALSLLVAAPPPDAVPLPAAGGLLAAALGAVGFARRQSRHRSRHQGRATA